MNNKILAIAAGITLATASCGNSGKTTAETETAETTPAQELIARLDSTVASGKFFFGHHDDTAYGYDWQYVDGNSDVKRVTGEYPGLMSWDLGMIELDSANNLDGVPFSFMASEIIKQNGRGGINAISWHPRNPASGGDSWDVSASPLHLLAQDSTLSATMDSWIGKTADFISSLKDAEGNPVPVIFRPWHENSGTWFWWGTGNSTPEEYIDLWKRTRRIFDEKGVNNVVWAYSPDKDLTPEQYFSTYPGDEYVDILGTDIYHFDGKEGVEQYKDRIKAQLSYVTEEAKKRGKIAAFTETGLEGLEMSDWYTNVLLPSIGGLDIAYVCVWRNARNEDKAGHFYVPYPGHPAEADFKAFHDKSNAIFVK